jgi:hypothetical protein
MPSTYTTNGGIELPANGEQSGTWGETVNDNMAIIDRLTNGVGAISLSGTTHTLTTADGTLSDGQYNVLVLGGSPSGTNTITISPNDGEHVYIVKNASGQTATFTQGSGANVSVLNNTTKIIYADGAGAGAAVVDITGALDLGSLIIAGTAVTSTAAELNYNDITTLGTVQASKTVTANASGDVLFPDGDKAIFGAGSDLQIYHDGSDSIISEAGTGILSIRASSGTYIQKYDGTETMAYFGHDDGVYLYYDNALKFATTTTGIDVAGTVVAGAGTALLPSITTTGDLNTGMWFPAADTIAFSEGGVEALRIDSSGNVGIGTTSPRVKLDLRSDAVIAAPTPLANAVTSGVFAIGDSVGSVVGLQLNGSSYDTYIQSRNMGAGSAAYNLLLQPLGGNVGIGETAPDTSLHVTTPSGTKTELNLSQTAVTNYRLSIPASTDALTFVYGSSAERMRIDSSGNLLVGTTSTIPFTFSSGTGAGITSTGTVMAGATAEAGLFNRIGSDGSIVNFYKAGAIVGSIGTSGGAVTIGKGITTLKYLDSLDTIHPNGTGSGSDGLTSLGWSNNRFKDLYLSGGVVFGDAGGTGTPTANTLDSYEEGTFTATLTASTSAPTTAVTTTAYYTKTGNVVNVFIRFSNKDTSGASGDMSITGLPFTSRGVAENQAAVPMMHKLTISDKYVTGYISGGATSINFINNVSNAVWSSTQINATTAVYLNMNMTYQVA